MWWNHLKRLIALDNSSDFEGFDTIAGLKTGEGVVFVPSHWGREFQKRKKGFVGSEENVLLSKFEES